MDEKNVQQEQTSQGDASGKTAQSQPFTPEQTSALQEMLKQLASEAEERGARRMQGVKDKEIRQLRRQSDEHRLGADAIHSALPNLDPEAQQALELAELKQRLQYYQSRDMEESARKAMDETIDAFESNMTGLLKTLGIDSKDKRIEWGERTDSLTQRQSAIHRSLEKLIPEVNAQREKDMEKRFRDMETKLRSDLGLESEKGAQAGTSAPEGEQWLKDWADGKLPATKENMKKASKLTGIELRVK